MRFPTGYMGVVGLSNGHTNSSVNLKNKSVSARVVGVTIDAS